MPRKPLGDRTQIALRLAPALAARVDEFADLKGISRTDALTLLIATGLDHKARIGVLGVDTNAAVDGAYAPRPVVGRIAGPVHPLSGAPIAARKPYQKGQKR